MEPEDFEKVPVDTTHTIEITDFVPAGADRPDLLPEDVLPRAGEDRRQAIRAAARGAQDSKLIALAKVTLRQKEQLCTLRIYENTIALETMFYADEIRSDGGPEVPEAEASSDKELKMAKSLVDMLTGDFEPEKYHDNYRDALLELIERKSEGRRSSGRRPSPARSRT